MDLSIINSHPIISALILVAIVFIIKFFVLPKINVEEFKKDFSSNLPKDFDPFESLDQYDNVQKGEVVEIKDKEF
jgi:hypothetical protein